MSFEKRLHSCLIFPSPLTSQDFENAQTSKIDRIQIFLGMALQPCPLAIVRMTWAQFLWSKGYQVIIRVPEEEAEKGDIQSIIDKLKSIAKYIFAIIWGNEPESEYDLTVTSENWGNKPDANYPQGKVFYHAFRLNAAIDMLQSIWEVKIGHIHIISPGWRIRQIGESDPEQPGQQVWSSVCSPAYSRCYANGVHVYGYGWESAIDRTRAIKAVTRMEALLPNPVLWINEFNVFKGTDVQQAEAFIEFGDIMKLNNRVQGLALFTSNGTPNTWPVEYLVQDTAAYHLIGQWISS